MPFEQVNDCTISKQEPASFGSLAEAAYEGFKQETVMMVAKPLAYYRSKHNQQASIDDVRVTDEKTLNDPRYSDRQEKIRDMEKNFEKLRPEWDTDKSGSLSREELDAASTNLTENSDAGARYLVEFLRQGYKPLLEGQADRTIPTLLRYAQPTIDKGLTMDSLQQLQDDMNIRKVHADANVNAKMITAAVVGGPTGALGFGVMPAGLLATGAVVAGGALVGTMTENFIYGQILRNHSVAAKPNP